MNRLVFLGIHVNILKFRWIAFAKANIVMDNQTVGNDLVFERNKCGFKKYGKRHVEKNIPSQLVIIPLTIYTSWVSAEIKTEPFFKCRSSINCPDMHFFQPETMLLCSSDKLLSVRYSSITHMCSHTWSATIFTSPGSSFSAPVMFLRFVLTLYFLFILITNKTVDKKSSHNPYMQDYARFFVQFLIGS